MSVVSVAPQSPSPPYVAKLQKTMGKTKVYHEFRSWGMPPLDIGRPGDVYLDVVSPYIIYYFSEAGWEPWNPHGSDGSQTLSRHPDPNYKDRYLWLAKGGLFWCPANALEKKAWVKTNEKYSMEKAMQDYLSATLFSDSDLALEAAPRSAGNKKCCDLELERRRGHAVSVPADEPQRSPHLRASLRASKNLPGEFRPPSATAPEPGAHKKKVSQLTDKIQDLENQNEELVQQLGVSEQQREYLTAEHRIQVEKLNRAHRLEVESLNYVFDDLRGHRDQALSRLKELESGASREAELQERLNAAERTIQRLQEESSQRQSALQTGLNNWTASLREISKDLGGCAETNDSRELAMEID